MLSTEMLAILGGGAILPYVAEAIWSWARDKREHKYGANKHRICAHKGL